MLIISIKFNFVKLRFFPLNISKLENKNILNFYIQKYKIYINIIENNITSSSTKTLLK